MGAALSSRHYSSRQNLSLLIMNQAKNLKAEVRKKASPEQAKVFQYFFKTGAGQYGEGDIFWGLMVPECRRIAKKYFDLPLSEVALLLKEPVHELRLIALLILVQRYERAATLTKRRQLYQFYYRQRAGINNWDLVDLSVSKIMGAYLLEVPKERKVLNTLSQSANMWDRRLAMIATFAFIRANEFQPTLQLAKKFLNDKQDLMHKASGWMLREVGKRDQKLLLVFLNENAEFMPRTMLRYAIERFPEPLRKKYLAVKKR